MFRKSFLVLSLLTVAMTVSADVFSDCHFWLRGGGTLDPNGNGLLDRDELVNAMTGSAIRSDVYDGNAEFACTNQTVIMPMRGCTMTAPVLYFPQRAVITDEATGAGTAKSCSVKLYNVFNDYTDKYSFIIRFRPDEGRPLNKDWSWILNMGYGASSGMMLGLSGNSEYRTLRLFSYKSNCTLCSITNGCWTDLGVSINGTNFTWVASTSSGSNESDANVSHLTTRSGSFSHSNGGLSTKPQGTALVIGTESPTTGSFAITNKPSVQWTSSNAGKAFRGSIQQVAFWKRALTADELREALAWPNPDVMKIGVQDGKSTEFTGADTSSAATMNDTVWKNSGTLAAGEELSFRFSLRAKNNHNLPQFFRWVSTPDSPAVFLRVAVNGRTVRTVPVPAGGRRNVYIAGEFFRAGDNELVVTRTDTGAESLKLDAAVLGGSWMVGLNDGGYNEFAHENSPGVHYWTLDANWKSVRRALLGAGHSASNQYWHISLPPDLAGRYPGRLTLAIRSNAEAATRLRLAYDGNVFATKMAPQSGDVFVRELTPEELGPGDHIFYTENGVGTTSRYWCPDYLKFELIDYPRGTFLIMR